MHCYPKILRDSAGPVIYQPIINLFSFVRKLDSFVHLKKVYLVQFDIWKPIFNFVLSMQKTKFSVYEQKSEFRMQKIKFDSEIDF